MTDGYFEAPVFIREISNQIVDTSKKPYFYNELGNPRHVEKRPSGACLIDPASKPKTQYGCVHKVSNSGYETNKYGKTCKLNITPKASGEVEYQAIWVTKEAAAAFGITLINEGECIKVVHSGGLYQNRYEYGVFAGHQSPYQGSPRALLPIVCTDLEHHSFPHVFASTDPGHPLVISVARYAPHAGEIWLADLWVPLGKALYIPASPAEENNECIYLHNNRNSARACWGDIQQKSVVTYTTLQTTNTFTYWYWDPNPTAHLAPPRSGS